MNKYVYIFLKAHPSLMSQINPKLMEGGQSFCGQAANKEGTEAHIDPESDKSERWS